MKKSEIEKIRNWLIDKNVVGVEQLQKFIMENFKEKNSRNMSFYIFDLKKANVLYQLDKGLLRYADGRKEYVAATTDTMQKIWDEIQKLPVPVKTCIWQSSELYQYMEQQPFRNYIFVEVEKYACETVFFSLKNLFKDVFLDPLPEERERYLDAKECIIVRPLPMESPVNSKKNAEKLGFNKMYKYIPVFPSPKAEKLLVDIFCDKSFLLFNQSGEMINIYKKILKYYEIDFLKLMRYAKTRNKKTEIIQYVENVVNFNIHQGTFND